MADPVFIPYASALDIQPDGSSPFDGPQLQADPSARPSYHDQIPEEIITPLPNRLGYDLPAPSSVSVSGPASLMGGEDGTYRASTPNLNATYDYAWEWRAIQRTSKRGSAAPGWTATSSYVPFGEWQDASTSGAVFTHSFPCGTWGEVRATASAGALSITSDVRRTFVGGDCGTGGGHEGAFTHDGDPGATKTHMATPELHLGVPTPNPASGSVRFAVAASSEANLSVYDALGRVVARPEATGGSVQMDLAGWPAGVYTARLTSETDATARRFVVTR